MGRQSKYSTEVRERAIRLVLESLGEHESETINGLYIGAVHHGSATDSAEERALTGPAQLRAAEHESKTGVAIGSLTHS